jgi:mannose-6-phosphate isomerase-like protein (cupin superfamily)
VLGRVINVAKSVDSRSGYGAVEGGQVVVAEGRVLGPEEGKRIPFPIPGASVVIKASGLRAPGDHDLIEISLEPGSAGTPSPHVHRKHEELFYVVEGQFGFLVGDRQFPQLGPGSFIHVPPGVVHDFRQSGSVRSRFLLVTCPAGFDRYFEEMSTLYSEGKFSEAALRELRLKHDTDEVDVSWGR